MRVEDVRQRRDAILGWPVQVVSYRLGERFHATVDNVDPGARIGAGEGSSREAAEAQAAEEARSRLSRARRTDRP